jgi:hypothetical protein
MFARTPVFLPCRSQRASQRPACAVDSRFRSETEDAWRPAPLVELDAARTHTRPNTRPMAHIRFRFRRRETRNSAGIIMLLMWKEPVVRTGFPMACVRQPVRRTGSTLQGAVLPWIGSAAQLHEFGSAREARGRSDLGCNDALRSRPGRACSGRSRANWRAKGGHVAARTCAFTARAARARNGIRRKTPARRATPSRRRGASRRTHASSPWRPSRRGSRRGPAGA